MQIAYTSKAMQVLKRTEQLMVPEIVKQNQYTIQKSKQKENRINS